jgi:hypothetical protein
MKITKTIRNNKYLSCIFGPVLDLRFKYLARRDPRKNANRVYRNVFNRDINWQNPTNLIEKIYWLQLFTDTNLWTLCADKYKMREYVISRLGSDAILPKNYGHWKNAEDIDYSKLPESFVLKTTQGCGLVLIVHDKAKLDIRNANNTLNKWLKIKYGFTDAQVHYSRIKPCIIAEELLVDKNKPGLPLVDYKVWCFHGNPEYILIVYDRKIGSGYKLSAYDLDWNNISEKVLYKKNKHYGGKSFDRPVNLKEMLRCAKLLSRDFVEVRVDFYEVNGNLYVGELTFTTGYGYHSYSYYKYLGSKIDLSRVKMVDGINKPPRL